MERREFLQRLGWSMAALGISEAGLSLLGRRYYQALAQPTSGKLALLVGINQYPTPGLIGGVTDVELQRSLLIHRFGFRADDILTLTNSEATREKIISAFIEHLVEQAGPETLVVFHFSGYGRRVSKAGQVQNSLMPVDGGVPSTAKPQVNDLLVETLGLLLRSLGTQKVVSILDTSYLNESGHRPVGNLQLRARFSPVVGEVRDEARALPEKLEQLWAEKTETMGFSGLPGVVLAAANPRLGGSTSEEGKAFGAQWNGFSTGLFTYALTQQLWLGTPGTTLQVSFARASEVVTQLARKQEQPSLSGQNNDYLTPNSELGADGVVRAVESDGKTAQLWLGGLPPKVMENYGVNGLLKVVQSEAQLQITGRDGLTAKAKLKTGDSISSGQLVTEEIRVLPGNLSLTVGLSASLERIELVDATSAFSSMANVKTVTIDKVPQPADCLFSKIDKIAPGEKDSYGLFWPGKTLISNTAGEKGEAVKTAAQRMGPQLQALRAAKMLRLTENAGSSRLGVRAVLEMVSPEEQLVMQRETMRYDSSSVEEPSGVASERLTVPVGSRIRYRLENKQSHPIYFLLLGFDNNGSMVSLGVPARVTVSPVQSLGVGLAADGGETAKSIGSKQVIPPGETRIVPGAFTSVEWAVKGPPALVETQLIFSIAPFTKTLEVIASQSIGTVNEQEIVKNPLALAQALLLDLQSASKPGAETVAVSTDYLALDVKAWATLSFIYSVV